MTKKRKITGRKTVIKKPTKVVAKKKAVREKMKNKTSNEKGLVSNTERLILVGWAALAIAVPVGLMILK